MKKFIILFVLVVAATQIKAQVAPAKDIAKILKFTNDNYDMGKTAFGKTTEYNVGVTNISKDTVTIDNVQVACGCTTPKYTRGAKIAPGKTETIVLGFNGSTMGAFTKNVTLFFSEGLTKMVTFKGEGVQ